MFNKRKMNMKTKKLLKFIAGFTLTAVGIYLGKRYRDSKKKVVEVGKDAPFVFPMLEGDITVDVAGNGTLVASMSEYGASGNPLMIVNECNKDIKKIIFDDSDEYIGLKTNLKAGQCSKFTVTTEYTSSAAFLKGCKSRKVHYAVTALTKEDFNDLKEAGLV